MALSDTQQAVMRWRKGGPALFAKEVLGATPTEQQEDASRAIVERRRVSIRSGHGTGKSTFMAWSVLWFLSCYFPAKVPATAPTSHQLEDVLWSEIAKWHRKMGERFPSLAGQFEWTQGSFRMASAPNESFSVARTSRPERPEALQGFHSEHILFLIDEASGVSDNVFEVAEGALSTDGAYVLMAANPTRQSGYFYDSHHKMRASWAALHWDGSKSPMVSADYIASMAKKYGIQSSVYKVRVLGEFVGASDGVIPLELCEAAKIRQVECIGGQVVWGVDVARFGDDSSSLAKRQGNHQIEPIKEWWGKDTMQTAGLIKAEWDATHIDKRPAAINIDVIGIGAGVVDRLKELGLPVCGINVAETEAVNSGLERQFNRLRDELWWKSREWLERKDCKLIDDDETIAELTTPTYSILSNGLIKVEGKDEMKKRGVKSPNRADAWNLTFANSHYYGIPQTPLKYPKMYHA
ncbi:MAG: terminase B [Patescibacteria group bacterium]|nr:terminase B [Patescibacteria group bacterium]